MSNPTVATEQLLELLLTLKKTTPQAARNILNAQPAIAYALITLMVSMNAVNIEVFQKTLAEYGAAAGATSPDSTSATTSSSPIPTFMPTAISAIPPHLQAQYRSGTPPTVLGAVSSTPPTHTPDPPYAYTHPFAPTNGHPAATYGGGYVYPQGYNVASLPASVPSVPPPTTTTPSLPDALANIPADQKALILRVLTMTSEQINALPPAERATYIQIRTTLGVSTS